MSLLLGLDIGTTSNIGILIDADGRTLATASRPVTLHADHPGWAEEDAEDWWRNVCAVCRELVDRTGIDAGEIAGIGVTGMLPAVVLLDGDGQPVRRSIQQSDGRVSREVAEMAAETDAAAFLQRTGNGITQQLVGTKLRWLAKHEPETLDRAETVFGAYDFIVHRLTGARSLEANWALESGFYDIGRGDLADDLLALGHARRDLLPTVRKGHAVVGAVTPQAAAATGLATGTPVVAGAADHIASAFVAGVKAAGDVLIKFGGAGDIMLSTDTPRPDHRLFLDFHIVPDLWMPNGCMACSGSLLNWMAGRLAVPSGPGTPHARLDALAGAAPPGADGLVLLPYFLGEKTPVQDPDARGTLVGLGLHHDIGHLWRATLEAVVFGFRHHVAVARELGYPVTRILASDGGTASAVWMQIAADALQQPVHLLEGHPGSCLGAAYVAGVGVGALDGWDGIDRFVRPGRTVEPRADTAAAYDHAYGLYRDVYEALKPLYPRFG